MKLRIQAANMYPQEPTALDTHRVEFVAEDGRIMFEVASVDGRSIEVRGVESTFVKGTLYSQYLEVIPKVSNLVVIRAQLYDDI